MERYNLPNKTTYYNGCKFDSRLELRFCLLMEENNFAYLVHPKKIYDSYYRNEGQYVEVFENTKSYTPDFLIRSIEKNVAYFIEIKPEDFSDEIQLYKRNKIIARYCNKLTNPIDFRVVYGGDFKLGQQSISKYDQVIKNQKKEKKLYDFRIKFYGGQGRVPLILPNQWSSQEYVNFVKYGNNPQENNFHHPQT
ncbi:MAG: hypothetical protein R8N23_05410 [Reichenbachiella sp.]|uniref:hypothetical protein n=1 Tax=Reichenbachiella sp. TaxID=2184521 RepID=UPI002965EFD6|nr:hypothetical protein [Reichenbachiella sp.]MDW3209281.1 hypothetical protein [Reichenbachiella sp.]